MDLDPAGDYEPPTDPEGAAWFFRSPTRAVLFMLLIVALLVWIIYDSWK